MARYSYSLLTNTNIPDPVSTVMVVCDGTLVLEFYLIYHDVAWNVSKPDWF